MRENRWFYLLWLATALAVLAIAFNGQIAKYLPFLALPTSEHLR